MFVSLVQCCMPKANTAPGLNICRMNTQVSVVQRNFELGFCSSCMDLGKRAVAFRA